jgi:hypothetical protein
MPNLLNQTPKGQEVEDPIASCAVQEADVIEGLLHILCPQQSTQALADTSDLIRDRYQSRLDGWTLPCPFGQNSSAISIFVRWSGLPLVE